MDAPTYLHIRPGEGPPHLESVGAFKAVLVIEDHVASEWQATISDWLVRSGCRYMMAWGRNCSSWDDSVDLANLKMFDYGQIPEDDFVMTTWHADEPLEEAFWYSVHAAMHASLDLRKTYIIHIAPSARESELMKTFRDAQSR
jgi:hypothetical protein